mgnify:CR=1 FL=1
MAKLENRQRKTLTCTECKSQNYRTEKNVKKTTDRLETNIAQNVKSIQLIKKKNNN